MVVDTDFSDVGTTFEQMDNEIVEREEEVGNDAVNYAKENGNYKNHTGKLRASNNFHADKTGLELRNDADYASYVEAKGYDVLTGAALLAEKELNE